jgi:hypothetical protein
MIITDLRKPYPIRIYSTNPLDNKTAHICRLDVMDKVSIATNGTFLHPRRQVSFILTCLGLVAHQRARICNYGENTAHMHAYRAVHSIGGRTLAHATALAFEEPRLFMPDPEQRLDSLGLNDKQLQLAAQLAIGKTLIQISGYDENVERKLHRKLLGPAYDTTPAQDHPSLVMFSMLSGELQPYLA